MILTIEMTFEASHLIIHRAVFQKILVQQVKTLPAINIQLDAILDLTLFDFDRGFICFSIDGNETKKITTDLIIDADDERSMC